MGGYNPLSEVYRDPTLFAPGQQAQDASAQHQAVVQQANEQPEPSTFQSGGSLGAILSKLMGGETQEALSSPQLFGIPIRDLIGGAAAGIANTNDTMSPLQALASGYLGGDKRITDRRSAQAAAKSEADRTGFADKLKLADFMSRNRNVDSQISRRDFLNKNPTQAYGFDPDERAREVREWAKTFRDEGMEPDEALQKAKEQVNELYGDTFGPTGEDEMQGEGTEESPFQPTSQREAETLPSGAYFMFNGQLRQMR